MSYGYNANDWLTVAADPNLNLTNYDYNANGLVTQVVYGNGTASAYSYDDADRLTNAVTNTPSGGTGLLRSYSYTLDNVGNRLQTVEQYTQGQIRTITRDYEYDDLYRLTAATEAYEGPPANTVESSYTYDAVGNRQTKTTNRPEQGGPPPPQTTVYAYNDANWLLSETTDGDITAYSYDNNGNRVQVIRPEGSPGTTVESYQYDSENRMTEYSRIGNGADDYLYAEYDGLGRRFAKGTQQGNGNTFWTEYSYSQLSMDPLAEYPQTGSPRITHLYRGQAGKLIGMAEQQGGGAGKEYWFNQDGLGNIANVTKHSGQSSHDYFYAPFGGILDNNGKPEDSSNWTDPHNHYLLNGKEWDEEMSLYYFGARYYDAATGVWLTQDAHRGEIRQPVTLHRTLYVAANPTNYTDAYGYRIIEIEPDEPLNPGNSSGGGSAPISPQNPVPSNPTTRDPYEWKMERIEEVEVFTEEDNVPSLADLINAGNYGNDPLVTFEGTGWTDADKREIESGALTLGNAFARVINWQNQETARLFSRLGEEYEYEYSLVTGEEAFLMVYGEAVTFNRVGFACGEDTQYNNTINCAARTIDSNTVRVYTAADDVINLDTWAVHELGHAFVNAVGSSAPIDALAAAQASGDVPDRVATERRNPDGTLALDPDENVIWEVLRTENWGFAGSIGRTRLWQQSTSTAASEEWADMMIGFAYNEWETFDGELTDEGQARSDFMGMNNMAGWINTAINNN